MSIDAEHRGELLRRSDEASVMEAEQEVNMSRIIFWSTRDGKSPPHKPEAGSRHFRRAHRRDVECSLAPLGFFILNHCFTVVI